MTRQSAKTLKTGTIPKARAALSEMIDPTRIFTESAGAASAAAIWNGAVDHRPALTVRCSTVAEVQHTVRTARRFDLPISVRGGGHDWVGRAICEDGVVVDLSMMREVSVKDRIATVSGGGQPTTWPQPPFPSVWRRPRERLVRSGWSV